MSQTITSDASPETDVNAIVNHAMTQFGAFLEGQIKSTWETLELYKQIIKANPNDEVATQQANALIQELRQMIPELLDLRKKKDFLLPETRTILSSLENVESICPDCGTLKKND